MLLNYGGSRQYESWTFGVAVAELSMLKLTVCLFAFGLGLLF